MPYTYNYFLGAYSDGRFQSLIGGLAGEGEYLYIVKGCPGCGKSTFMRSIGEHFAASGCEVEYIMCTGDPGSLDGVRLPEIGCAFVDGTSPHVCEPGIYGADSEYIDLGRFVDTRKMTVSKTEIAALFAEYRRLAETGKNLAAAMAATDKCLHLPFDGRVKDVSVKRAEGIAQREFKGRKGSGNVKKRLLSAVTGRGRIFLRDTVNTHCDRVYYIDNDFGFGSEMLSLLKEKAESAGIDTVECLSPLDMDRLEGLILPGLRLGFICGRDYKDWGKAHRHIRLDALGPEISQWEKDRRKELKKLIKSLEAGAVSLMAGAGELHGRIEECYAPCVDFAGITELKDRYINLLERR